GRDRPHPGAKRTNSTGDRTGQRRQTGEQAAGRVYRTQRNKQLRQATITRIPERAAAGLHGTGAYRSTNELPLNRKRQDRQKSAARPGSKPDGAAHHAQQRNRSKAEAYLGRSTGRRKHQHDGRLFRAGRPFTVSRTTDLTDKKSLRDGAADSRRI